MLIIALFFGPTMSAQNLKMTSKGSFDNRELRTLLSFQNMDYYNISISGEKLKGKNYYILSREIWNGTIKKTDTIFSSRDIEMFRVSKDTLSFQVISGKTSDKNLRVMFSFDRFAITRNFKCTKSSEYSLRDFGSHVSIETGKPFYALAYILPTEHKDGSKSWCEVEADGTDIEKWGQKFGIKHYVLFEMKLD